MFVSLAISGMNCNPEIEGRSLRYFFFLDLKLEDPLLVWIFEVGRHIQAFDLDLEAGKYTFNLHLLLETYIRR